MAMFLIRYYFYVILEEKKTSIHIGNNFHAWQLTSFRQFSTQSTLSQPFVSKNLIFFIFIFYFLFFFKERAWILIRQHQQYTIYIYIRISFNLIKHIHHLCFSKFLSIKFDDRHDKSVCSLAKIK